MGKAKKKRNMVREEIPCIVFLSSNKNKDEELAEKKKTDSSSIFMIMQRHMDWYR